MNSAIGILLALMCLSPLKSINSETTKQQQIKIEEGELQVHNTKHVNEDELLRDEKKVVNIDINNDAGGLKIFLPNGEIYVPSERKNVHIKTIDVFEEKTPIGQSESDNDKYDADSFRDEDSSEDVLKSRGKKPPYGAQPNETPQIIHYIPNYHYLVNPNFNPYDYPHSQPYFQGAAAINNPYQNLSPQLGYYQKYQRPFRYENNQYPHTNPINYPETQKPGYIQNHQQSKFVNENNPLTNEYDQYFQYYQQSKFKTENNLFKNPINNPSNQKPGYFQNYDLQNPERNNQPNQNNGEPNSFANYQPSSYFLNHQTQISDDQKSIYTNLNNPYVYQNPTKYSGYINQNNPYVNQNPTKYPGFLNQNNPYTNLNPTTNPSYFNHDNPYAHQNPTKFPGFVNQFNPYTNQNPTKYAGYLQPDQQSNLENNQRPIYAIPENFNGISSKDAAKETAVKEEDNNTNNWNPYKADFKIPPFINPFIEYYNSKFKNKEENFKDDGNVSDFKPKEENGVKENTNFAMLKVRLQVILKNVCMLIANYFDVVLPPVAYQIMNSLTKYLLP